MIRDKIIDELPEEIKKQAELACEEGCLIDNPVRTWLDGFAFCLEGKITCYEARVNNLVKEARGVLHIIKNCPKNELALDRAIFRVEEALKEFTV